MSAQPEPASNSDSDDGNPLAKLISNEATSETGTGTLLLKNISDAAKDMKDALATTANVALDVASKVMPVAASVAAPVAAPVAANADAVAVSANVFLSEFNEREIIERGLREFTRFLNSTSLLESYVTEVDTLIHDTIHGTDIAFIKLLPGPDIPGQVVVSYCNPSISGLSDFVPHYNLFLFHNGQGAVLNAPIHELLQLKVEQRKQQRQEQQSEASWKYKLNDDTPNRFSLQLLIGPVFNVPVFTVHIMHDIFHTDKLPSALTPVGVGSFRYNAKSIGPYTQLDLMLELWMHSDATSDEPYAPVNVLVARGMNELCVNIVKPIQDVCDEFNKFIESEEARARVTKNALIAVMQNPAVKTKVNDMDMHFFDIFPSGQYGMYFNQVVPRCDSRHAAGLISIGDRVLTRTDIIVAALTAVNAALRDSGAHIVAGGGAAVSYYLQDFLNDARTTAFDNVVAESGVNMVSLLERCHKIPMNDIDCFVFGNVSRQFLLIFSLYMMILYENFYGRARLYHMQDALAKQEQIMQFFGPSLPYPITLFMYGNRNTDVNTQLISKRLAKNPKVQLVTQETKCFSQISHPACIACNEDVYYMQPIDLVKKEIQEFVVLYEISLYTPDTIQPPPDLYKMVHDQYMSDNMVSLKTTMLDIICIFCDEGKSLFIRIFMARKNPKDFARLRVFIDMYLLRLLQSKQINAEQFSAVNATFIAEVSSLRANMHELDEKYYLKQGHIAAISDETASQLDADRTKFLKLLRSIGRQIVNLPDPFGDRVPAKFRATAGAEMIDFFKSDMSMKYRFDMGTHMNDMVALYTQSSEASESSAMTWLNMVFETIRFIPGIQTELKTNLAQILDPVDLDGNRKIGFKKMQVRTPFMLRLHHELEQVKPDYNLYKNTRYKDMFNMLLRPISEFVRLPSNRMMLPTTNYVGVKNSPDGIYDLKMKRQHFPRLVNAVLDKKNPVEFGSIMDDLKDRTNTYDNYDDEVKKEIGRILLDYYRLVVIEKNRTIWQGGRINTRKRSRRHKMFNAKTRSRGNKRSTSVKRRSKLNKSKYKHKHTRRVECNVHALI